MLWESRVRGIVCREENEHCLRPRFMHELSVHALPANVVTMGMQKPSEGATTDFRLSRERQRNSVLARSVESYRILLRRAVGKYHEVPRAIIATCLVRVSCSGTVDADQLCLPPNTRQHRRL